MTTKPAAKRSIKPHKGGRTARAPQARLTPDDLEALKKILTRRGITFADWLVEMIWAEYFGRDIS